MSFVCFFSLSSIFPTQQSTSIVSCLVCTGVGWLRLDFDNLVLACAHNTFTGILGNVLSQVLSLLRHYT